MPEVYPLNPETKISPKSKVTEKKSNVAVDILQWFIKKYQLTKEKMLYGNIPTLEEIPSTFSPPEQSTEPPLPEIVSDPLAQEQIKTLEKQSEELTEAMLLKVSERLGSNRGGWYEHQQTRERFYVKLYDNPDRARVEFIANAIYQRLGIRAAQSELLEMGDQLAVASQEIPGSQGTHREEQKGSTDVREGFVADAYLANWDVVGLCYDNIVRGSDGHLHRIDNGGSLTFRAMGTPKDYSPHEIPELQSMRQSEYPAGQVFEGVTEEEMREQARKLVENLSEEDIDTIITQSGLQGDTAQMVRKGLLGRRRYLIERFRLGKDEQKAEQKIEQGESAQAALTQALERLEEQSKLLENSNLRARVAMRVDRDKIEGQRIDLIDARDQGSYLVTFKLTSQQYRFLTDHIAELYNKFNFTQGVIAYRSKTDQSINQSLTSTYDFDLGGGVMVKVNHNHSMSLSSQGLVQVEISCGQGDHLTAEEIWGKLEKVFKDLLDVPEALSLPTVEDENKYKAARFRWHHRIGSLSEEELQRVEQRLVLSEVCSEYSTYVEPGKHHEYEQISPYAIYHEVRRPDDIINIITTGSLLSTSERYRRGLIKGGMSSGEDLTTGGADSVFTRIMVEKGIEHINFRLSSGEIYIILNPDLVDRTDWYTYQSDHYGSTRENVFQSRLRPMEFFQSQCQTYTDNNEQMFRLGIGVEKMIAIVCLENQEIKRQISGSLVNEGITEINGQTFEELWQQGEDVLIPALQTVFDKKIVEAISILLAQDPRMALIKKLRSAGINQINGRPIEQFIVYGNKQSDLIKASQENSPQIK